MTKEELEDFICLIRMDVIKICEDITDDKHFSAIFRLNNLGMLLNCKVKDFEEEENERNQKRKI